MGNRWRFSGRMLLKELHHGRHGAHGETQSWKLKAKSTTEMLGHGEMQGKGRRLGSAIGGICEGFEDEGTELDDVAGAEGDDEVAGLGRLGNSGGSSGK